MVAGGTPDQPSPLLFRVCLALDAVEPVASWIEHVPDVDHRCRAAFGHRREIAFQDMRRASAAAAGDADAAFAGALGKFLGERRRGRDGRADDRRELDARRRRNGCNRAPSPCGIAPAGAAAASAGEIAVVEAVATGSAVAGSVLVVAWGSLTPISIGGPELVQDAVATIATMHAANCAERLIASISPGRCDPLCQSPHYGFTARSSRDHGAKAASAAHRW